MTGPALLLVCAFGLVSSEDGSSPPPPMAVTLSDLITSVATNHGSSGPPAAGKPDGLSTAEVQMTSPEVVGAATIQTPLVSGTPMQGGSAPPAPPALEQPTVSPSPAAEKTEPPAEKTEPPAEKTVPPAVSTTPEPLPTPVAVSAGPKESEKATEPPQTEPPPPAVASEVTTQTATTIMAATTSQPTTAQPKITVTARTTGKPASTQSPTTKKPGNYGSVVTGNIFLLLACFIFTSKEQIKI